MPWAKTQLAPKAQWPASQLRHNSVLYRGACVACTKLGAWDLTKDILFVDKRSYISNILYRKKPEFLY